MYSPGNNPGNVPWPGNNFEGSFDVPEGDVRMTRNLVGEAKFVPVSHFDSKGYDRNLLAEKRRMALKPDEDPDTTCPECFLQCKSPGSLRAHVEKVHAPRVYGEVKCPWCRTECTDVVALADHHIQNGGACERAMRRWMRDLEAGKFVSVGEDPINKTEPAKRKTSSTRCEECGRDFNRRGLAVHRATAHGVESARGAAWRAKVAKEQRRATLSDETSAGTGDGEQPSIAVSACHVSSEQGHLRAPAPDFPSHRVSPRSPHQHAPATQTPSTSAIESVGETPTDPSSSARAATRAAGEAA